MILDVCAPQLTYGETEWLPGSEPLPDRPEPVPRLIAPPFIPGNHPDRGQRRDRLDRAGQPVLDKDGKPMTQEVPVGDMDKFMEIVNSLSLTSFRLARFPSPTLQAIFVLLLRDEQFLEVELLPGELGCILDRRADQSPPHFKSGLAFRVARRLELRVA